METVDYETARKLREIGFSEPCLSYYNSEAGLCDNTGDLLVSHNGKDSEENVADAPYTYQALDWFRKEKGIYGYVVPYIDRNDRVYFEWAVAYDKKGNRFSRRSAYYPEEDYVECVRKLIKYILEKILEYDIRRILRQNQVIPR